MSINTTSWKSSMMPFENFMQKSMNHSLPRCTACGEYSKNYRILPLLVDVSKKTHQVAWKILNEDPRKAFKPRSLEIQVQLEKNPELGLEEYSNQLLGLKVSECACRLFDRFRSWVRNIYEDRIIETAMKNIAQQINEKGFFDLNLTLYKPGKLGAEVILLGLLMKEISGLPGCLNISLIEPEYKGILYKGKADKEGFQLALTDFRKILYTMSLQTGVEVSPVVCYEEGQDYQSAVKHNRSLSYDLLLGSDLGGENPYSPGLKSLVINTCNAGRADAIILYGDEHKGHARAILWHNGKERLLDSIKLEF